MQSVQSVCIVLPSIGCQEQRLRHPEACWEDYEIKALAGHLPNGSHLPLSCRTVQGMECIRLLLTIMLIVTHTVCFNVMSSIKYQRLFHRIRGQQYLELKPFMSRGTHKKQHLEKVKCITKVERFIEQRQRLHIGETDVTVSSGEGLPLQS